jgi:hypothetical protein
MLHNVCGEYKMVPATADGYKIMLLSNSFELSLTNQIVPHASLQHNADYAQTDRFPLAKS